jgi:sec-independent protein translocase protein TatC
MAGDRSEMSFLDHLDELRKRLIRSAVACIVGATIAWYFVDRVIDALAAFVGKVYFMAPAEAFTTRLKLSVIMGIMLAIPVISYQLWQFVSPGLYPREKKMVVPVVLASTLFFAAGASFCYFLVLPAALKFLMGYGTENLNPLISVGNLLSFCAYFVLSFGIVFELPVAMYFLGRIGVITHRTLRKFRRYAIVLAFIIGAILTPPDVFSQLMLSIPLLALYELSIAVVWLTGRERTPSNPYDDDEREIGHTG